MGCFLKGQLLCPFTLSYLFLHCLMLLLSQRAETSDMHHRLMLKTSSNNSERVSLKRNTFSYYISDRTHTHIDKQSRLFLAQQQL